jgi:membrane peptidoglycan carboxypeptidase
VIEFGPGIYGIGRATHHYFGKAPAELTPRESVFFSSILPSPKRRYVQYCHQSGQVDAKWDNYLKRILKRMHERKRLTDAEYAEAIAAPLTFSRAEATSEHECMALVKRITGGPPWPSAK